MEATNTDNNADHEVSSPSSVVEIENLAASQQENSATPATEESSHHNGAPSSSDLNNIEDRTSIVSIVCRICFDDNKEEAIITPCRCKGTVAFVHKSCLEKWLSESNTTTCELCHHIYETERVPKYTVRESVWKWMRHQPNNLGFRVRQIRCDLIACAILTPLAMVITYICLFSADYYNQQRFSNIPTARWTSVSLLVMIAIMLFGYYIWVYVVVGYHGRMWYYWWQRECIVRYIPPPERPATSTSNEHDVTQTVESSPQPVPPPAIISIITPECVDSTPHSTSQSASNISSKTIMHHESNV